MTAAAAKKTRTSGPITVGRYVLHQEIASGGMATVYMGRLAGPAGFSRVVAIKRMHDLYAADPEFVTMFLDEASLAARIQHPNVAATLDVVAKQKEIFIVMDYVHGESLAVLLRTARKRKEEVPASIVCSIACGVLAGLHAAHIARGDGGEELHIVHRDVSPQNILIGPEGLARVVDFGVAKATSRLQASGNTDGRGKLGYTAPERLRPEGATCDARADLFAVAVVMWEMLAGRRLFTGVDEGSLLSDVLTGPIPDLSETRSDVSKELWAVLAKGLARPHAERWSTAEEFARAIEASSTLASSRAVGDWVVGLAKDSIAIRERAMREMEGNKRQGSTGDAMNLHALVEEIESKSTGDRRKTSAPPPAGAGELSGFPSQAPTKIERVSAIAPLPPPQPLPREVSSPDHSASASHEPIVVPGLERPAAGRKGLWVAIGAVSILGLFTFFALRGGPEEPIGAGATASAPVPTPAAATVSATSAVPEPPAPTAEPVADPSGAASASAATSGSAEAAPSAPPSTPRPPSNGIRPPARPPNPPTGPKPGYLPDRP